MKQIFIFDLDGTLYPRSNGLYFAMSSLIRDWFKNQLNISDTNADRFFDDLRRTHPSALEAIQEYGLSLPSFHSYVFGKLNPDAYLVENKRLQLMLGGLAGDKFIVTLSSREYSERVLRVLGISHCFSEIYNPGTNWHTSLKIDIYEEIRKNCGLFPGEICIVGDNYEVDLETAYNKGYRCVLLSGKKGKIQTIRNIENLDTTKIKAKNRKAVL